MCHKDANLQLTNRCCTGFYKAAQSPDHLRFDRALLTRQKDANLLTKKCGTGFQKAAQNLEQSSQADVTVFVYREQQYILKA